MHTFLRHIRLHKYSELLQQNHVTLEQLLAMDEAGLERLGMHAKGARTRLLKAIDRYNEYSAERAEAIRNGLQPFPEEGPYGWRQGGHGRQSQRRGHARHSLPGAHPHRTMHQSQPVTVPHSNNNTNYYRGMPRRSHYPNVSRREPLLYGRGSSWKGDLGSAVVFDEDHEEQHVNAVAEHLLGSLTFDDEDEDDLDPYTPPSYVMSMPHLHAPQLSPSSAFGISLDQAAQSVTTDWPASMSPASYPDLWGVRTASNTSARATSPWDTRDKMPTVKAQ